MTFSEVLQPVAIGVMLYGAAWMLWRWCLLPAHPSELQAEKRAKLMLGEFLTDEEHRQLSESGYLAIGSPGLAGRIYRIREEGRSVDVYDSGKLSMRIRFQPSQEIPAGDLILMHKFMIEGSEQEYLRSANTRWRRSINSADRTKWIHKLTGRRYMNMLTKVSGGETVRGGVYWSLKDGEFVCVPKGGGKLEGGSEHKYIKAPLPVVLCVGPIMGLAFAMFLPLSGILVLVPFLVGKVRSAVSSGKVSAAHMASLQVQPGTSYLGPSGNPAPSDQNEELTHLPGEENGKLEALAAEIAERRWREH